MTKFLVKKTLSRYVFTFGMALLAASFAPQVFAQVKVAVVDLQRALNETEDGRQAKAKLKRLFTKRQEELDRKQNDLKKEKEDIEKLAKAKAITQEQLQQRFETYQRTFMELQNVYMEYQRELAAKEADMTKEIISKMQDILRRIGQAEGYTIILERNEGGVVWVPTSLDLTDVVIQRYNTERGGAAAGGTKAGASKTKAKTKQ